MRQRVKQLEAVFIAKYLNHLYQKWWVYNLPFVEAGDSLGHLRVGGGGLSLPLLGYLVEGIHVGLVGGHLLLEGLGNSDKSIKVTEWLEKLAMDS